MRYAWDLQHQYLRESGLIKGIKSMLARTLLHKMRLWDTRTANAVDEYVANSRFIGRRIRKIYGRAASVIYPPVDVQKFEQRLEKEDFYLTASRLVPYKRVALIVEAFRKMPNRKLVVIGDGPEAVRVREAAGGAPNIILMGYHPTSVLRDHMQRAKAFVFAAREDFGIMPLEAQACGTPVIAYGAGGSLETVRPLGVDRPTGLFFHKQSPESICDAVEQFELHAGEISPADCRAHAEFFSIANFRHAFRGALDEVIANWGTAVERLYRPRL